MQKPIFFITVELTVEKHFSSWPDLDLPALIKKKLGYIHSRYQAMSQRLLSRGNKRMAPAYDVTTWKA